MLSNVRVSVVGTQSEPCPFNHVLLFETPGYGVVPHRLLHVICKWARPTEFGVGEGIPYSAVTLGKYLPVAPVPPFPPRPS